MSEDHRILIQTRKNHACSQLFNLYTGYLMAMMIDPLAFILKTGLMKRNIAMFRDTSRKMFQGKISDELPDFDAFIDWQKKYRQSLTHVNEFYAVGSSSGGYAALLFGHYLQVDEVWSFSPLTRLDDSQVNEHELQVLPQHRDLSQLLANWNGKTKYHIYYCEDHPTDPTAAQNLAGCEGVTLYPQHGETHVVVDVLDKNGLLPTILPPLRYTGKGINA